LDRLGRGKPAIRQSWNTLDCATFLIRRNGGRESAMAFHFEDQAAQEKIIGNFFLALIAAVVILILYKGVVLF
jgi:hypothetical protein